MYTVTEAGVLKRVESWSVMLPLKDNDGNAFAKATVDEVLQQILLSYPGFSITNTLGYWKGADQTFIDQNYQVLIDAVPDTKSDSSVFFGKLKQSLQQTLKQEKIYLTKQGAKEELLSFAEFFAEIGVEISGKESIVEAERYAQALASNYAFVQQRLGYETVLVRRDSMMGTIVWERRLCGLILRSEFKDSLPPDIQLIAADQYDRLGAALDASEPFVLIGSYEFLMYSLDRTNPRSLVESCVLRQTEFPNPYTRSPTGELLDVVRFVEQYTASVFVNCLILREEGFLPRELTLNVGSDGSMQRASNGSRSIVMTCAATIPEKAVQVEVIRCLGAILDKNEKSLLDPIAVAQAKAKNAYFLKRSIVRHTMREKYES
ncbi:MAG: hypothetical protein JWQ42_2018 [Edaphobacter sp.]|nr:hypothetical protein [Edaphobacter sp.]